MTDEHQWFTSSFSGGGASCVEVRFQRGGVAVRDSKNPAGAVFVFGGEGWRAFVARCAAQ